MIIKAAHCCIRPVNLPHHNAGKAGDEGVLVGTGRDFGNMNGCGSPIAVSAFAVSFRCAIAKMNSLSPSTALTTSFT